MPAPKGEEIKVRVTAETKQKIVAIATRRGEAESVIIREAITEYLAARAREAQNMITDARAQTEPKAPIRAPRKAR